MEVEGRASRAGKSLATKKLAAIEGDYRCGHFSTRQVAARNAVSEAMVRRLVKRYGWTQDLRERINQRTAQLIEGQALTSVVVDEDEEVVERAAHRAAEVLGRLRVDAVKMLEIGERLQSELMQAIESRPELEQAAIAETETQDAEGRTRVDGLARARLMRAISVPAHIDSLKNLSAAMEKIHNELYRAWSIVVEVPKPPGDKPVQSVVDERLDALAQRIGEKYGLPPP